MGRLISFIVLVLAALALATLLRQPASTRTNGSSGGESEQPTERAAQAMPDRPALPEATRTIADSDRLTADHV